MFRLTVLALALVGASAFVPSSFGTRARTALDAGVVDTIASLDGPNIYWGSDGVAEGHEESDIKGQDTFKVFSAALASSGLDVSGDVTVLAPCDTSLEGVTLDEATIKCHIIDGKYPKSAITGDVESRGGKLYYKYFARQTFLNDAVIGIVPQGPATGQVFPVDVDADGAVVHGLDRPLIPGWTPVGAEDGLGGIV